MLSVLLCLRQSDHGPVSIEYTTKVPHNAHKARNHADPGTKHELDFEIADTKAWPPIAYIVRWPDERVHQVHHVGQDDVEDESGGGKVAITDVPDKRRQIDDDGNQCEHWESNGGRRERKPGSRGFIHVGGSR